MADLTMRIGANIAELKKGLSQAQRTVSSFGAGVKTATSNVTNSFRSMGSGLGSALSPQIAILTNGLGSIVNVVKTMVIPSFTSMGVAFASTGIGAIIIAIVAGLGAIYTWVTRTVGGTEKWSEAVAYIGGLFDGILDRVSAIGQFIYEVFTLGWKEAKENLMANLDGMLSIKEVGEGMYDLKKRDNELWRKQQNYAEKIARLEAEVAEHRMLADDTELSISERKKNIILAIEKQKELDGMRIELSQEELAIAEERAKLAQNDKETEENLTRLRVQALNDEKRRDDAQREMLRKKGRLVNLSQKEQEELAELNRLEEERFAILLKIERLKGRGIEEPKKPKSPDDEEAEKAFNNRKKWAKKQQEEADERAEEEKRRLEETENEKRQMISAGFDFAGGMLNAYSMIQDAQLQKELAQAGSNEEAKEAIRKKYAKKKQKMSIASALVNGAEGVTKTIANLGMPLAIPFIALTLATVGAQIASISSQKFANGGVTGGGIALVGERGKELVNLPAGSRVHSAHDTMKMLNGAGGGTAVLIPDMVIKGSDIYVSFKEEQRKRENTR